MLLRFHFEGLLDRLLQALLVQHGEALGDSQATPSRLVAHSTTMVMQAPEVQNSGLLTRMQLRIKFKTCIQT
jgi:hypothetical protein